MLTNPAKMQEAINQLTDFLTKMEVLLISIDAHLANIDASSDSALNREKNGQ